MSEEPPAEGAVLEQKKGLGKYVSRMRSILRRGDSTKAKKRWSSASLLTSTKESPAAPTDAGLSTSAAATSSTPVEPDPLPAPVITMRSGAELERIRKLAEKYDIKLETKDWKVVESGERVEKPIRMRVHRTCHKCNASFGATRLCSSCGHRRCQACPRFPKKKDSVGKGKGVKSPGSRGAFVGGEKQGNTGDGLKKYQYVLKLPSKTGGQDLVMRKPKQRVRRSCHRCNIVYLPGSKTCAQCTHVRCVNCPRDPPKRHKYPDGYPGDVFGSDGDADGLDAVTGSVGQRRIIPRYFCHSCSTIFKPDSSAKCADCGHERCSDCQRVLPRKVKAELDPDVVRRVEEKLKGLSL